MAGFGKGKTEWTEYVRVAQIMARVEASKVRTDGVKWGGNEMVMPQTWQTFLECRRLEISFPSNSWIVTIGRRTVKR